LKIVKTEQVIPAGIFELHVPSQHNQGRPVVKEVNSPAAKVNSQLPIEKNEPVAEKLKSELELKRPTNDGEKINGKKLKFEEKTGENFVKSSENSTKIPDIFPKDYTTINRQKEGEIAREIQMKEEKRKEFDRNLQLKKRRNWIS